MSAVEVTPPPWLLGKLTTLVAVTEDGPRLIGIRTCINESLIVNGGGSSPFVENGSELIECNGIWRRHPTFTP